MSKLSWRGPKLDIRTVTLSALLVAFQIILSKIPAVGSSFLKIGVGFIGTAIIGYLTGPWISGSILVLVYIINHTILMSSTAFFPGFIFSDFITGIIAGAFLYHQKITWQRIFLYEFVQMLISNILFTTIWVYLMSLTSAHHMAFYPLFKIRLVKEVICWPIQSLIEIAILKAVSKTNIVK